MRYRLPGVSFPSHSAYIEASGLQLRVSSTGASIMNAGAPSVLSTCFIFSSTPECLVQLASLWLILVHVCSRSDLVCH